MSRPSVVLVAAIDDAVWAHGAQRGRALERLGCDVTTVNVFERRGPLGLFRSKDLPVRLGEALRTADPDLIVVIGVPELELSQIEALRRQSRAVWVNWYPDDMRTIATSASAARAFDRVYAVGTDVMRWLADEAGVEAELLPLAADPSVYRPERSRDQQYRANVVFAGSATPGREAVLSQLVEFGLAVWGPGWRGTSLRDYCRGESIRTTEFVRAYAGASVALNLHHDPLGGPPGAACNQRVFELGAIGVPQIVDAREDLDRWMTPGDDLFVFADGGHLKRIVEDLLQDQSAADRVAQSGRARVLAEHTYMHRMERILEG